MPETKSFELLSVPSEEILAPTVIRNADLPSLNSRNTRNPSERFNSIYFISHKDILNMRMTRACEEYQIWNFIISDSLSPHRQLHNTSMQGVPSTECTS